jgi:hypothetical protein
MTQQEQEALESVMDWNKTHKIGTEVSVLLDDKKTEVETTTISQAHMIGCGTVPIIFLADLGSCIKLERVRPVEK